MENPEAEVDPAEKFGLDEKCYVTLIMANGNVVRYVAEPQKIEECMAQFQETGHFTMETHDGSTIFAMTHALVLGTVNTRRQIQSETERREAMRAAERLTEGVRSRR